MERAAGWIARLAESSDPTSTLRALRRFVLLHGFVRGWLWVAFAVDASRAGLGLAALLSTIAFAAAWHPRLEARAPLLALGACALQAALTFPLSDNHFFVEAYALALVCLAGDEHDDRLALGALRALTAIVLFHTGLQKLLHGQYLDGQFLAFMVGQGERFSLPFSWVLPAEEIARLQGYDPLRTGAGPYRVESTLFVAASNAVWIAELALPIGLVVARTRLVACAAAIALVASIQLAARELGFAFLFVALLLVFTERGLQRALPVLVAIYLYALLAVLTGAPGSAWLAGGSL